MFGVLLMLETCLVIYKQTLTSRMTAARVSASVLQGIRSDLRIAHL